MTTSLIAAASRPILNPTRGRRKFNLLDAMILVAATAVASGIAVWIDRASGLEFSWSDVPRLFAELFAQAEPDTDERIGMFTLTEPDWVDRAGRAMGAYWIIMGVCIPGTILLLEKRA